MSLQTGCNYVVPLVSFLWLLMLLFSREGGRWAAWPWHAHDPHRARLSSFEDAIPGNEGKKNNNWRGCHEKFTPFISQYNAHSWNSSYFIVLWKLTSVLFGPRQYQWLNLCKSGGCNVSSCVQEYKAGWFSQIYDHPQTAWYTPPCCSSRVMSVKKIGFNVKWHTLKCMALLCVHMWPPTCNSFQHYNLFYTAMSTYICTIRNQC